MKSYEGHGKPSRIKWFMIGLLTGIIGCVASFTVSWEPIIQQFNKVVNHSSTKTKIAEKAEKVEKPEPPTPQFDFYSMLPMDEPYNNASPEETKPVSVTPQPVVTPTPSNEQKSFILQVASFNQVEEAQRLKKQLLHSGYAANIEIFVKGRKTWYRVVIGPFNDTNEAQKQQQKLKEARIDSLLLTQKS